MRDSKGRFFLRVLIFALAFVLLAFALGFALSPAESFTRQMLHDLQKEKGTIKTAFVGASHALYGFDTQVIDRELATWSFNLGSASQKPMDSYFLLKEMYRSNQPDLVVIELTYAMYTKFSGYDNPLSSMILFDYFSLSANKLDYLKTAFKAEDYPDLLLKAYRYRNRLSEAPSTIKKKLTRSWLTHAPQSAAYQDEHYQSKGFVESQGGFQQGGMGRVTPYKWDQKNLDPKAFDYLEEMIALCRKEGSRVILVSTPLPMATLLTLGNYQEAHRYFEDLANAQGLLYYDFNLVKAEYYDRPDTDYFDTNHLNGQGAASFSQALCQVLNAQARGEDTDIYFHPDFQSLSQAYPHVSNVYLQLKESQDQITLAARSYQGDLVVPLYRFLMKEQGETDFTPISGYSPEPSLTLESAYAAGSQIRVEAKAEGSSTYDAYDVILLP